MPRKTLKVRKVTLEERAKAGLYHAKWGLTAAPMPAIWIGVEGWDRVGAGLLLAVAIGVITMWVYGMMTGPAGYTVDGIRVRSTVGVIPEEKSFADVVGHIKAMWSEYVEDPCEHLDGLTVMYVDDVALSYRDPRYTQVDPMALYYDHPWHRIEIEKELVDSAHTLAYEMGHPLTYPILDREGLPHPGSKTDWEKDWALWRKKRGLTL